MMNTNLYSTKVRFNLNNKLNVIDSITLVHELPCIFSFTN